MAIMDRLPRKNALTRGTPVPKAMIWPLLHDNWKTVRDDVS